MCTASFTESTKEGDALLLICQTSGTPPLIYSWMKDEQLISSANDKLLKLQEVTRKDSGNYSCKVVNLSGTSTSDNILIDVPCK